MNYRLYLLVIIITAFLITNYYFDKSLLTTTVHAAETSFQTIEWTDLIPKEDLEALKNPPEYINSIEDGSAEDQLSGQLQSNQTTSDNPYEQALISTRIKPEYNNRPIKIPGFIVPLEFNDNQVITSFFLVPFFGACIHQPPPPPNQIIYAKYPKGIQLTVLYDPFWISGTLKTTLTENNIATAAYSMEVANITPYID